MSSENDVPLGGESRRYYEQKFGDRIRKVSKGGGSPERGSGGGSNWNGRAGAGLAIGVVFIIIRIVIALSRSQSNTPSYTYTPPPSVKFDAEMQKRLNPIRVRDDLQGGFGPNDIWPPVANPIPEFRNGEILDDHDVPLLEGLCYRINRESLQPEPTPGGRIRELLGDDDRELIASTADGQALEALEGAKVLIALSTVLWRPDFSESPAFNQVAGFKILRRTRKADAAALVLHKYNRSLLELCYPDQIVPLRERENLNEQFREQWRKRAQADLAKARQKYEPAKR